MPVFDTLEEALARGRQSIQEKEHLQNCVQLQLNCIMGCPKLLIKVGGRTILERVADAALASTLEEIIVVLGRQPDEPARLLAGRQVKLVYNPCCHLGQSTSLAAGIKAVDKRTRGIMFILALLRGTTKKEDES